MSVERERGGGGLEARGDGHGQKDGVGEQLGREERRGGGRAAAQGQRSASPGQNLFPVFFEGRVAVTVYEPDGSGTAAVQVHGGLSTTAPMPGRPCVMKL